MGKKRVKAAGKGGEGSQGYEPGGGIWPVRLRG